MFTKKTAAWLLALMATGASASASADTAYAIDFKIGTDTVTGSIVIHPDATIVASDIVGYSLKDALGIRLSSAIDGPAGCVSSCGLRVAGGNLVFDFGNRAYAELDFPVGLDAPDGFAFLTAGANARGVGFLDAKEANSPHFEDSTARVVLGKVVAPEIDPGEAAGSLLLLLGNLLVMVGKRRNQVPRPLTAGTVRAGCGPRNEASDPC